MAVVEKKSNQKPRREMCQKYCEETTHLTSLKRNNMNQTITLNAGDTLTVTVATPVAPVAEVIQDVKVENTDGTSETLVPETPAA